MNDNLNLDRVKAFINEPMPRQILFFDEMLTPKLIQLVYWAALIAVLWSGLGSIFSGTFYGFVQGLVMIVFGSLAARVASELVMLGFQVHENLETIATNTAKAATKPSTVRKKATKKVIKKTV